MPDSYTLKQLHRIIQIVMGWQDSHLHEFSLNGKRYGESNPEDEENVIDERTVRLRDLALSNGDGIGYVYDFGDDWQHQLVLEAKLVSAPQSLYPACIAGERNSPPEDVGGVAATPISWTRSPTRSTRNMTRRSNGWAEISIRKRSQ